RAVGDGGVEEHARGEADDATDFVGRQAADDEGATSGVGAVGGGFPVAVVLGNVRLDVRVAADADAVRHRLDDVGQLVKDPGAEVFQLRAAQRKHRAAIVVDDLDAHALGSHI